MYISASWHAAILYVFHFSHLVADGLVLLREMPECVINNTKIEPGSCLDYRRSYVAHACAHRHTESNGNCTYCLGEICQLIVSPLKCLWVGGQFKFSCIRLECWWNDSCKKKSARVQYLSSAFINSAYFNTDSSGRSTALRRQVKNTTQMQVEWNQHENKPYVLNILENVLKKMNFKLWLKFSKSSFCLSENVEKCMDNISSFICMNVLLRCVWVYCVWLCMKNALWEERNKPPVDQLREVMAEILQNYR